MDVKLPTCVGGEHRGFVRKQNYSLQITCGGSYSEVKNVYENYWITV
jgi:hypothetical protein